MRYGQELKARSFIIPISELTIERKLAEGGQGVVYVGNWGSSTVAIKSLKSDQSEGFETEVSLLASLRHPCILTFYGISITNDSKYMITEYLSGGSLEKLIYSSKTKTIALTYLEKINILKDIAIGMNYLHTLTPPIIHRDLVSFKIFTLYSLKIIRNLAMYYLTTTIDVKLLISA